MLMARVDASLFLVVLLMPFVAGQTASKVKVLYTGDPFPGQTPYIHMKAEPFLEVTPVQASRAHYAGISAQDIMRAIRVYMPRTYESLVRNYDVVIISDSNVDSFTATHRTWFRNAVADDGAGLVMIGGYETFGGVAGNMDWGVTPVGEVLPVDTVGGVYEGGKVTLLDLNHAFMRSLPWRADLPFLIRYDCNVVDAREGANVLAVVTLDGGFNKGYKNPFFSTWEYRNGTVFAMTGDWTPGGGAVFLTWEYLPDFATNLMLYCAKRPIPENLDLVHTVRTRMATLAYRRIIITSLIDFVDKFGANPKRIFLALQEADAAGTEAADLYLMQEFDVAKEGAERALQLMDEAEAVADKVKNEALLWVYVSEWLSVTGTSLVCGFLLWTLMIQRRMYKEVAYTQFRGR